MASKSVDRGLIAFEARELAFAMNLDGDGIPRLDVTPDETLDRADFGIVAMARDGEVLAYNTFEAALSRLDAKRVVGRRFFTSVAPCTNNVLVAHRFDNETALDHVVDYLFTYKLAPTPVRLRLLKHSDAARMYLFVERRAPE